MNILIIKVGALGDVLRTIFIAQALKDKYRAQRPHITWVTHENALPLLKNNTAIDVLLPQERKNECRKRSYDLVINLEEDKENAQFVASLSAKKIIGFIEKEGKIEPTESAREWYAMSALGPAPENDILKRKNKKTHRQILGEIVGIEYEKYEPFLRLTSLQRRIAEDFMRQHTLSRGECIIGINTGAADRWPKALSIEKTVHLIDTLYKKYRAKIILFGGPNEIQRNEEIIAKVKSPLISAGCGNDLIEFPALLSVCQYVITTDSLCLHIALALKRKTICLVGPTSAAELEMYGLGEKVIARSSCVCCYKKTCKSMEKINESDIMKAFHRLQEERITFLITAYKEPSTIGAAIQAALNQKTNYKYDLIVAAPDEETIQAAKKSAAGNKNVKIIKDPGKGKSYALNTLFKKIETDILILSDGDVYVNENAVEELVNKFKDPMVGCVSGQPIPQETKETKYGYWANFLFQAAHTVRKNAEERHEFIECSGYLFAFRKKKIEEIPLDVAEDTIIPYMFWEKGYDIGYAPQAQVFVKNVTEWSDWVKQKIRTSKAHETLEKYVNTLATPRVKSFTNEAAKGVTLLVTYPHNAHEWWWTFQLGLARLYMWGYVLYDTRIKNRQYGDAWERVESTK